LEAEAASRVGEEQRAGTQIHAPAALTLFLRGPTAGLA
jgi:hypothetical protein